MCWNSLRALPLITCERITSRTSGCNTLQHNATHCNILKHTATHLQHTATHCIATHMPRIAIRRNTLVDCRFVIRVRLQHTAMHLYKRYIYIYLGLPWNEGGACYENRQLTWKSLACGEAFSKIYSLVVRGWFSCNNWLCLITDFPYSCRL